MALTISYDGFGVVANADSATADSAGGSWAELGGGSIGDNPDVYLYGSQSIGSQYASKSGYSYFTANTALNFTTTEAGQLIYMWINIQSAGAFLVLATDGFHAVIGSDTSNYYKFPLAGKDDSNGWSGGWKCFVLDITLGQVIGTPDDTAINTFGLWIDTDVSVRADSVFQSQIMCAKGLKVEGTSTNMYEEIVTWCEDYTNRAAGMFQSRGQTYFSLGALTIHSDTLNTVVSSSGSNVEYEKSEFHNGTIWTTSYLTTSNIMSTTDTGGNTVSMTDTNVGLAGNDVNKIGIDVTLGTIYTKTGGYLKYSSGTLLTSSDTLSSVVISLCDPIKSGGATLNNITFNSPLSLTNGALEIVNSTDFAGITNIIFNSYTGGYAVYIPASVTGTVTFDNWIFDGTGTDVYWAGTTGTLTVALTNGSNATTSATGGGLVAFENSVALSITNLRVNTEVRIYRTSDNSVLSGIEDVTELDWLDTSVTPNVQYYKHTYSYNAGVLGGVDTYIMVFNKDYQDIRLNYTLLTENASLLIQQTYDRVSIV